MHRFVNFKLQLLPELTRRGVFEAEPFILLDAGCSNGIHPIWRRFGDSLIAFGFDPWLEEIEKLTSQEDHPHVHYMATFLGLSEDHPFKRQQAKERARYIPDNALQRACHRALRERNEAYRTRPFNWVAQTLSTERTSLADVVAQQQLPYVDFIKIDTDGTDLEIAISCEPFLEESSVLGFAIEANLTGSFFETENTFPNVDRFMRKHGFKLFDLSYERCARAALPMPFVNPHPGRTLSGQVIWGDYLYLRDPVDTAFSQHWRFDPSPRQLLKLIALYEIFGLSDCAAELAVAQRTALAEVVDVDWLLDTLTPPLQGKTVSYEEYLTTFYTAPTPFFPATSSS